MYGRKYKAAQYDTDSFFTEFRDLYFAFIIAVLLGMPYSIGPCYYGVRLYLNIALICHALFMCSFIGPGNNKAKECGYKMYVNRSYNEKKQSCTKHDAHHKGIMGRHDMSTLSVVLGPVLLTLLRHVARILANGRAAFFESCDAIGWNSCDVSQKR